MYACVIFKKCVPAYKQVPLKMFNNCSFFRGSNSIKCLPEAKEAGGSDPGIGGTFSRVLSVHSEFCGPNIENRNPEHKIWFDWSF